MITQTFQVTSSKHSNICSMSSSKAKLSFSFTPTFEINEEAKYPSLVKSVPFKSKSQQIESDSSDDEYAGLKVKPEPFEEVQSIMSVIVLFRSLYLSSILQIPLQLFSVPFRSICSRSLQSHRNYFQKHS